MSPRLVKTRWIAGSLAAAAGLLPLVFGLGAISAACSVSLFVVALLVLALAYSSARESRLASFAALCFAVPLSLVLAAILALIEQGETVVLRTFDERGQVEETRLWVVDFEGSPWLGAGGGETRRWYQRLSAVPEVEVVRQNVAECFRAEPVPDPQVRDAVIDLTREKYRLGNLGLSIGNSLGIPMRTPSIAVPVRLLPCGPSPSQPQPAGEDGPAV